MVSLPMPDSRDSLINNLKKTVFYDLLDIAGRVFIVVRYSENVVIGTRGFLPDEKENGLVLVFNPRMNFRWENDAIHATLSFKSSPQKCHIPADDIIAIYSPEVQAQFVIVPRDEEKNDPVSGPDEPPAAEPAATSEKVVKVDFRRRKK